MLVDLQPGVSEKRGQSRSAIAYAHCVTLTAVQVPVLDRMRRMRHRTPRYVYNRARQMWCEHAHPDYPWLTPGAVRLLASMLRRSDRGAEFGSGRSTVWFAQRVGHLTSVEHDEVWHRQVSARLKERGLVHVDYILAPRDQPPELGASSKYAHTVSAFDDATIDFALVDGLYREHVTKLIMPKIRPGGLLIIDNANWYLPPPKTHAPASRTAALGPDGPVWKEISEELADWRTIWTTCGVWDTAIFIKP
jgi:predicted O-methyltransferase YrrM